MDVSENGYTHGSNVAWSLSVSEAGTTCCVPSAAP